MVSIRKIGVLGRTYRHLSRYRQILAVFFRYGFDNLVDLLRIDEYIEIGLQLISRKPRERIEKLSRARRVRMAFEELGPTFIKLGQVLSSRPDLVPVELLNELSRLQDKVPPAPYEQIRDIVTSELGSPPETVFAAFDATPFASASIGQVHRAETHDGEAVAVKVMRPDIRKIIEVDLEIMLHLATLTERHIEELTLHGPVRIVEEFAHTLEREMDYTLEAASMERIASDFLGDRTVYIPKVYRETTTARVLTMEIVDGIKVSDVDRIDAAGLNRERITHRGADLLLRQVFDHGFFHGDPHPGNVFVLPGDVIGLVDFGITGSVSLSMREDFVELVHAVVHRDEVRVVQVLLKITEWDREPDLRRLEMDAADFMSQHLYKPLRDIQLKKLLQHLLEIAARHRLRIPPDIFLMMKTLATVEGVALVLDPAFDMVARTAPFIERIKRNRFRPDRLARDAFEAGAELVGLMRRLPRELLEISRLVKRRQLPFQVELAGLEAMLSTHDQISNRIAFAIIIAGLIVGSSILIISELPPLVYGISLIGMVVFAVGAVMGIWLLVAILRSGRL
jgi:ubiquinone biosynthesis protein